MNIPKIMRITRLNLPTSGLEVEHSFVGSGILFVLPLSMLLWSFQWASPPRLNGQTALVARRVKMPGRFFCRETPHPADQGWALGSGSRTWRRRNHSKTPECPGFEPAPVPGPGGLTPSPG